MSNGTSVTDFEKLKELNLTIRHWETLLFENAKSFFTGVTVTLGAAGAVVAWSTVGLATQRMIVSLLLLAAIAISAGAIAVTSSTQAYLKRHYSKRGTLGSEESKTEKTNESFWTLTGWTVPSIIFCFVLIASLCGWFLTVARSYQPPARSVLQGARLQGADLSMVKDLTEADLTNACGDSRTKLPPTFRSLPTCPP